MRALPVLPAFLASVAMATGMSGQAAAGPGSPPSVAGAISQDEFEHFMTCYGHMAGSLELLQRIRPLAPDPEQIEKIRRSGLQLMNARFGDTYEDLTSDRHDFDLFEGERARQRGSLPFDSLAGMGLAIQYERFRTQAALSDDCIAISENLRRRTTGAKGAAYSASLIAGN